MNVTEDSAGDDIICEGVDAVNTGRGYGITPTICLSDLADTDGDGVPDILDNCALNPNPNQVDNDQDGRGNQCDDDIDGDGILNQFDFDDDQYIYYDPVRQANISLSDGRNDSDDNCPINYNMYQIDIDGDGVGDYYYDNEYKVTTGCDNCYGVFNPGQEDADGDGVGDACDNVSFVSFLFVSFLRFSSWQYIVHRCIESGPIEHGQ